MRTTAKWALCLAAAAPVCGALTARAGAAEEKIPILVLDASADDWVVDRFAGNSTAGPVFFQGPAREVGGLGRPDAVAPLPDGTVYFSSKGRVLEVTPDGTLRLVIGGGGNKIEGPPDQVQGGMPVYNPKEETLYLTGPNCLRRVVERPDGSWHIELVAGIPGTPGFKDGPAKQATFRSLYNVVINSRGTIYILDAARRLRRIKDGLVETLVPNMRGGKKDGPLAQARFRFIGLGGRICLGDDDNTLYVADHWNFCVRKIDLKKETVTTVAGKPKQSKRMKPRRYNNNADGPAMTHASFNSGCNYVCWDPVHKALWVGGPDESRFRWLKDGWVRTVIGRKVKGSAGCHRWPCNALGVPSKVVHLTWNIVLAVDDRGRAYLAASSHKHGLWRADNKEEVKR
ncbi:MAG: hypothetical protein R6V58_13615 [Planctomycetota bacterium]